MIMVETTLIMCEWVEKRYFSSFIFENIDDEILVHLIYVRIKWLTQTNIEFLKLIWMFNSRDGR